MSSNLPRGLAILELLSRNVDGLPLHAIAEPLQIPRSAAHRVLAELTTAGFVRQEGELMPYRLTLKLATLGMAYLNESGIAEVVQPVLNRLAAATSELARMSVVDGERLVWVAKAQGARGGLRYDANSDPGEEVRLFCSSNGQAWLAALTDERALHMVMKQGFNPEAYGPNAPKTITEFLACLAEGRRKGYSDVHESYEVGSAAIAAPVWNAKHTMVIGSVSVAGPEARMKAERMPELGALVMSAAEELSVLSVGIRAQT
ncbi:MAG: IclR family transcriptional regulator [Rhodoferax sp.]|nr:IclR family transcriptional regulator [Rhodoferax sp.]